MEMKKEICRVLGNKDDELDAQIAEHVDLRELIAGEEDDDLLALIDQYTGEEVGTELRLYAEALNAWLAGKLDGKAVGDKPDLHDFLMAAIGRACRRANLKLKYRPRG